MSKEMDYRVDHYCPAYEKVISPDLCYNSLMCLNGFLKILSTKELSEIKDTEQAKKKCRDCPYSKL